MKIAIQRYGAGAAALYGSARFGGQATFFLHSQLHMSTISPNSDSPINLEPPKSCDAPLRGQATHFLQSQISPNPGTISYFYRLLSSEPLPPIFAFGKVLTTLSRMGHHSMVLSLYREMGINQVPVPLDLFTLNVVINSCCRLRDGFGVGYGLSLLGAIFKKGYEPDTVTFNKLIKGLFLEGRVSDSLRLFNKLSKRCQPDIFTYGIVIDGLCKMGNVSMAIGLLKDTEAWNTVIYSAIIDGLCKNGSLDVASSFIGKMIKNGVMPDRVTCNSLIRGLFFACDSRAALKVFHKLPSILKGAQPDQITYGIVIDGLCKMGVVNTAETLFKDMKRRGCNPNTRIYTSLMDGLCKHGRIDEAIRLLEEMVGEGVVPNVVTFSVLINGLCLNGKLMDAWELFNRLSTKGVQPTIITYNTMINGLCQEGFLDEAEDLLLKMEGNVCKPDEVTFNTIICGFLKWNQTYKAVELIQKMVERNLSPHASSISRVADFFGADELDNATN